jgi:hypothetical protein
VCWGVFPKPDKTVSLVYRNLLKLDQDPKIVRTGIGILAKEVKKAYDEGA